MPIDRLVDRLASDLKPARRQTVTADALILGIHVSSRSPCAGDRQRNRMYSNQHFAFAPRTSHRHLSLPGQRYEHRVCFWSRQTFDAPLLTGTLRQSDAHRPDASEGRPTTKQWRLQ